jgi:formate hydrogenlyase subunit 6/NADH:ubiquinone oxidoreductase subunit I
MDIDYFIQYTLLELVCYIFILGISIRFFSFFFIIIKESKGKDNRWRYILTVFGRALIPFHMAVAKKPFYAGLRYVFHTCLIVIPIWYSEHIYLWSQYGFEWEWTALPDEWIDGLTLLLLSFSVFFFLRRIISKDVRLNSTVSDYVVIIFTAMPFLTGYLLSQGSLEYVFFFGEHMENIHVLTAEAMILMVVFLFCRVRLTTTYCTGCAACEVHCPTGALTSEDKENRRYFTYAPYLCICCGDCINSCPEGAAELRHQVSVVGYFQNFFRKTIRSVALKACQRCGALFAPEAQIDKLRKTVDEEYINLCLRCKREVSARNSMLV